MRRRLVRPSHTDHYLSPLWLPSDSSSVRSHGLPATLDREVQTDVEFGLIGKTAIHPTQIAPIESHYQVAPDDLAAALEILRAEAPAVFKLADTMCEPATHRAWAEMILARAAVFGESRRASVPTRSAGVPAAIEKPQSNRRRRHGVIRRMFAFRSAKRTLSNSLTKGHDMVTQVVPDCV